jgi:hypothetical protein
MSLNKKASQKKNKKTDDTHTEKIGELYQKKKNKKEESWRCGIM